MREAREVKLNYSDGAKEIYRPGEHRVVTVQIPYQSYGLLGLRITYEDESIVEIDYRGDYRIWWKTAST